MSQVLAGLLRFFVRVWTGFDVGTDVDSDFVRVEHREAASVPSQLWTQHVCAGSVDGDLRDRRPQWSVDASAGVQYNFSDSFGLYAEPGVGYYFDNGSNVKTIYKEKPFNFNLNVGFRLTVR